MKILYIVNSITDEHGWSVYTRLLAKAAHVAGNEVHVAVCSNDTTRSIDFAAIHSILPGGPGAFLWNPLSIKKLQNVLEKLIEQVAPDVIHVTAEPYIMAFAQMKNLNFKLILTLHGTYALLPKLLSFPKGIVSNFYYKKALKQADHFVPVSEYTKKRFLAAYDFVSPTKVTVVKNSVEFNESISVEPVNDGLSHVVTVGMVKERKGIHCAIPLLSEWAKNHQHKIVYDVVGKLNDGLVYTQKVRDLAKKYSHDFFSVHFHGTVSNQERDRLLVQAKLYIHLEDAEKSLYLEGFGIAIIEAAAMGIPALVHYNSATSEAVQNGVSGYVVNMYNSKQSHQALDKVLLQSKLEESKIEDWANEHTPKMSSEIMTTIYKK